MALFRTFTLWKSRIYRHSSRKIKGFRHRSKSSLRSRLSSRILCVDIVLALTDKQADSLIVSFSSKQVVGVRYITAKLTEEGGLEFCRLDLDHKISMSEGIVKQQIQKLLRLPSDKTILASHIRETRPHLYQKL